MKWFFKSKDGGPESKVTGYWLVESKRFGSIVLLKFDRGSREVFHTHAFSAFSLVLKGWLHETMQDGSESLNYLAPSFVYTPKDRYHRVEGVGKVSWALSIRGPWDDTWKEFLPVEDKEITLTNGRVIVEG